MYIILTGAYEISVVSILCCVYDFVRLVLFGDFPEKLEVTFYTSENIQPELMFGKI